MRCRAKAIEGSQGRSKADKIRYRQSGVGVRFAAEADKRRVILNLRLQRARKCCVRLD
jgi:hypothetical protein